MLAPLLNLFLFPQFAFSLMLVQLLRKNGLTFGDYIFSLEAESICEFEVTGLAHTFRGCDIKAFKMMKDRLQQLHQILQVNIKGFALMLYFNST